MRLPLLLTTLIASAAPQARTNENIVGVWELIAVTPVILIVGYNDDNEAFVREFLKNARLQSLADLIQSLPSEKQTQVKAGLATNANDRDKVALILNFYWTKEQMHEALKNASINAMERYVQTLNPSLSTTQRANLISIVEQVHPAVSA